MRAEQRVQNNLKTGNYASALKKLQSSTDSLGPHLGPLADICYCSYMMGDYAKAQEALDKLYAEYASNDRMSTASRSRMAIVLSRFLEERGEVAKAFDLVERAHERIDAQTTPTEYYLLLAQILRLSAGFGISTYAVPQCYRKLFVYTEENQRVRSEVEIHHALVLAEASVVGSSQACSRAHHLLGGDSFEPLNEVQSRTLFFDLIEELALNGRKVPIDFLALFDPSWTLTQYEQEIWRLVVTERIFSRASIQEIARHLVPSACLRILILSLAFCDDEESRLEIENHFSILVETLSDASKKAWNHRLHLLKMGNMKKLAQRIELSKSSGTLACGPEKYALNRRPILRKIFESVAAQPGVSIPELVSKAWGVNYNQAYYDRTRISLQRLNRILCDLSGVEEVLRIESGQVHTDDLAALIVQA